MIPPPAFRTPGTFGTLGTLGTFGTIVFDMPA
jgi:hypothetical protein